MQEASQYSIQFLFLLSLTLDGLYTGVCFIILSVIHKIIYTSLYAEYIYHLKFP